VAVGIAGQIVLVHIVAVQTGNMTNKIYPIERCKLWLQELDELKADRPAALSKLDDILLILVEEDDYEVAIRTMTTILRIEVKKHCYYDYNDLKNYRNYYERYAKIIVSMMSSQTPPPIYEIE
jgi:hypothetical protein